MQAERFRVGSRGSTVSERSGLVGECLPGVWRNQRRRAALFGLVSRAVKRTVTMMIDLCKALTDIGIQTFRNLSVTLHPYRIPAARTRNQADTVSASFGFTDSFLQYFPIKNFPKPVDKRKEIVYNIRAGVSETTAPVRYCTGKVRRSTQVAEEAPLLRV